MRINDIEPKFEKHDEIIKSLCGRIELLEEENREVRKRLEELSLQYTDHASSTADDAHGQEVELTGDAAVFKAAADAADEGTLQETANAIQEAEVPTNIVEEAVETAEEVVEKEVFVDEDATFPELEPEPEKVEPVATVEVVVSGDLDPITASLLKRLEHIDTDLVKVTVDER